MRLRKILVKSDAPEFGFGTTTNSARQRLMNKDGSANVARLGEPKFQLINIYHSLITMSWRKFNFIVLCYYIVINLVFTLLYGILGADKIQGMVYTNSVEKFWEVFFFSAQTLTTVGYGRLNPTGMETSTLAAIESLVGLLGFALATGLLYGRFSRPNAKLLFSDNAIIAPYRHKKFENRDMQALLIRIANARNNNLIEVEGQVLISYNEEVEGKVLRRFQILDLEISKISYLTLSWTIAHPIIEGSPFFGLSADDIKTLDVELLVNIKAIDETYAQQVHTRTSYKADEIILNARFVPAISQLANGLTAIDLKKISSYELV